MVRRDERERAGGLSGHDGAADEDVLYEAYFEAAMAGDVETPSAFAARHGEMSDALRARLEALFEVIATGETTTNGADAVASTDADDASGRILGDFRLVRRLGTGGMGVVYLAEQISLGRSVALKVIRPEIARSANAARRFDREARAIAKLTHPNIVGVYAVGEAKGVRYLAMELVEGQGLDEILRIAGGSGEGLPTPQVLAWGRDLARALHAAHEQGIVHRDVKPSNIRIDPNGTPRLLDFGLARDLQSQAVTLTEAFVGSPHYVAPEQVARKGGAIDGRTDVYSLGVLLYQCVTGQIPFAGESLEEILHQILVDEPAAPRTLNPSISSDLGVVIGKAMEKDPARRYQTATEFADDLGALLEFRPIRARPPGVVARTLKWTRRNPAGAASIVTVAVAVVALVAILAGQAIAAERARARDALAALDSAQRGVEEYEQKRDALDALEASVTRTFVTARYMSEEGEERLDEQYDDLARVRLERQRSFHDVLEGLRRAERLGADAEAVRTVSGRLYLARFRDAEATGDVTDLEMYRELALANDPMGEVRDGLVRTGSAAFHSSPTGADVYLFRLVDLADLVGGHAHRLVAVPFREGATLPVEPGTWALRVARGAGTLVEGDVIIEIAGRRIEGTVLVAEVKRTDSAIARLDRLLTIDETPVLGDYEIDLLGRRVVDSEGNAVAKVFVFERADGTRYEVEGESLDALGVTACEPDTLGEIGGVSARVWHDGELRTTSLPVGLTLRTTAAPVFIGPDAYLGQTMIRDYPLPDGSHLAVFRADGYHEQRQTLTLKGRGGIQAKLDPVGSVPEGFVPLYTRNHVGRWIMEREVTMREYLEFLNDPQTLAEIDAPETPIRYPRDSEGAYCVRDGTGRYRILEEYDLDWPVLGVSYYDAVAYADWKTRRARAAGRADEYVLPDRLHWQRASGWVGQYPFGSRFRRRWCSNVYARPVASPEPVMRFPVDQSFLGVYDLTGSASEWTTDAVPGPAGGQKVQGGAWGNGGFRGAPNEHFFTVSGGRLAAPDGTSGSIGFRLLLRREVGR